MYLKEAHLHVHAEVEYPCLSGERRHLPCINFKDSARPAELLQWLSWYSICLERRRSRVQVPPEAALLFFLGKKKSCLLGVIACNCLVSITDYSCTCTYICLTLCMCLMNVIGSCRRFRRLPISGRTSILKFFHIRTEATSSSGNVNT